AVTGAEQDGKKVYTITAAGRQLLVERPDHLAGIRDRMRAWGPSQHPQFGELMQEVQSLGKTLFSPQARGWWSDPEKVRRIRAVLASSRTEIEQVLRGTAAEPPVL
ncbi:MAG: hypothetical protein ACR2PL_24820, partial [Dehalococcoidia bacterium]